ncbi:hypothetical protein C0Q70_11491 [Pomacea canaliculata]|uniref:Uncharacterized protein n=2 Tax=Pomacea canaliculata TaxID=400727 RepID=A0A2T7P683_POMCA|nr:hypothetical protein C0Q70_11491 [Pomacea canaliculata]
MQLKTACCQAGMEAASGLVGAYQTVWHECKHSSNKFLTTQRAHDGRQICMNEFRFCCMDMATSLSTSVVTPQPETESSAEWDRDRDLVGKDYLPPHFRAPHAQARDRTSSLVTSRTPRNSKERSSPSGSLRARGSSSAIQPEVEDPQHKRRAEQRVLIKALRTQLKEEDDIDEDYRPVMKDPRRTAGLASPSFAARRREPEKPPAGSDQKGRVESELGEEVQNGKQSEAKRKRSRSQEVSAVTSADQDGKERRRTSSLEAARRRLKYRRHETEEDLLRWLLLEVDQDHVDDLVDEEENALGSEELSETANAVSAEYEDDDEAGEGDDEYFDSKDVDRSDEDIFASASKDRNSRGNSQNADKENGREEKQDGDKQVVPVVSPTSSSVVHSDGSEQGPQQSPSEGRKQPLESSRDITSFSGREPSEGKETAQTPARGRPEKGGGNSGSRSSASVTESTKETEIAADDLSSEDGHNSSRYYHPSSGGRSTRRNSRRRMAKGRLGKNVRREEQTKPRITEALEEE